MRMIKNALGRLVPQEIDGKKLKPFIGAYAEKVNQPFVPKEKKRPEKNKVLKNLDEVVEACQIQDGQVLSFHHNLRNGDEVVRKVIEKMAGKGLKDLVLAPSALFPCHSFLVEMIKKGVVASIEGSMNGPVGRACSQGLMEKTCILRSHGGRVRDVLSGDLKIDVAFIAASATDRFGNATGLYPKESAFGPLSFSDVDAKMAKKVVVVTDHLVKCCQKPSIKGEYVDFVVEVDSIGNPQGILSGTTKITTDPTQLKIARYAVELTKALGLIGQPFQAGAGSISLAATKFLGDVLKEKGLKAPFVVCGSTKYLVQMLNEGLIGEIFDAQSFDPIAVDSLRTNPRHKEVTIDEIYNRTGKSCIVDQVAVTFLGATEVDVSFNVNVNTHSDGWLLHGIGGHQDAAYAKNTFVTVPLKREKRDEDGGIIKRIPIIRDRVTTVTTPGELIDAIVTDQGIAINPKRKDLKDKLKKSNLPIVSIEKLKEMAGESIGIGEPRFKDRIIALIQWRDGTVIDTVRELDL